MTAPIAIFCFNRPDHLRDTLASLANCAMFADSPVHVFGDGPKSEEQCGTVEATRAIAREMLGERATYHFSEQNKGLARSIIDGVEKLTAEHGRVIVIEDDLALAPGFLVYMNAALDRYANDIRVLQVAGHMFDVPQFADRQTALMLPFVSTWGWATWARAWQKMDEEAVGWECLRSDRGLRRRFNLDGVYDYAAMMERQMSGKVDSWGIRWYWSVFVAGGLAVYPPQTLVRNRGFDGSGSHGRGLLRRYGGEAVDFIATDIKLVATELRAADYKAVKQAIWRQNGGLIGKAVDIAKTALRR